MIFSLTIKQVLDGAKTQTCRRADADDRIVELPSGEEAVVDWWGACPPSNRQYRIRWVIGRTYAMQVERGARQRGRIRITGGRFIENVPKTADEAFARREGFDSLDQFLTSWRELHGRSADKPAWAPTFDLLKETKD